MPDRIDPDNLATGTTIGVYAVVRRVGAGGFGTLYEVERDGRSYALKLSRERLGALEPVARRRFEERADREVAALKSLRHPNIVSVLAVDRWPELESGYPFIVMDFVDGERLDLWCRASSPSLLRICEVFAKIARAVHHMHERQLFHRDLKSENVLVRPDGEPILVDFGIARARASYRVTRQADVVGTATHYAPEYLAHVYSEAFERGVDFEWTAATDLHSIGYMLYEILAGRPPFAGDSDPEIWRAIQTVVPPAPSLVNTRAPGALDDVVLKLLEKDPIDRFQTGAELAAAIERILEDKAADPAWTGPFDVVREVSGTGAPTAAARRPSRTAVDDDREIDKIQSSIAGRRSLSGVDDFLSSTPLVRALENGSRPGAAPAPSAPSRVLFTPPSAVQPRFVPPFGASEETPANSAGRPAAEVPSAVRRVREQLDCADRERSRGIPLGLSLGLGLAAALLLYIAVTARSGRASPRPGSLLNRVQLEAAAATSPMADGSAPPLGPVSTSVPLPDRPAASRATGDPAPSVSPSAPSAADARAIDHELLARFGGRPTVQGTGGSSAAGTRPDPGWLRRSQPLQQAARAGSAPTAFGIPTGAHIPARLLTTLDSRTVGNGPVEVKLPRPFALRGEVVLPAGTLVYGRASAGDGRFTIRFTKMRLPDDREVAFDGIAMDHDDGRPGLAAGRRVAADPVRGDGLGTAIAKSTANVLLGNVSGGVAQDVAREAGQTALVHQDNVATPGGEALLLDPGVLFDVWVERAF